MKVQSAKPQISTQVPQSFDDTQVDSEFTEGFSELIAILNAGDGAEDTVDDGLLSGLSEAVSNKEQDDSADSDRDDLKNTMDSILFGLNPVPVQEIKQTAQQINADEDSGEIETVDDRQNPVQINTYSENVSSSKELNMVYPEKIELESKKMDAEIAPVKVFSKDKINNTEVADPARVAMHEIEAQTLNAAKHVNVTTPLPKVALQLDSNAIMQDKPSMVLQELGKFINQHTNAALTEVKPVVAAMQPTISYTQTLDKLSQLEPGMLISKSTIGLGDHSKDIYTANIKIHPPELGEVTATLKIDKNTAQLVLLTENDHVKSIVQSHIVQLKENFNKSDLYLTSVDVQTTNGDSERQHKQPDQRPLPQMNQLVKKDDAGTEAPRTVSQRINSLIDTYV